MNDNNTKSFSEKYPRINTFIGLLLIGLIVFVFIRVIGYLFDCLYKIVVTVSKLDAVVIVAIITGGISLVSVVISSIFSKFFEYRNSRRQYLASKREDAYKRFVDMVYKLQLNVTHKNSYSTEQMVEDIRCFSKELTLWGSPKVVKKWNRFRELSKDKDKAQEYMFILEEIMNEMRYDMGCKRVKKGSLLSFFINDIHVK